MASDRIVSNLKKVDIPSFVAEPNEIIFTNYTMGRNYQKQLQLRNISKLPAMIEELDIIPRNIFRIKIKKRIRKWQLIAPGLCMIIFVEFLPISLEESEGIITFKVLEGKETKIRVAAHRKHPILSSALNICSSQTHLDNVFDFGKCLVGSRFALEKKVKNIGGDGKFVLVNKNILWNELNKEELFHENNIFTKEPFSISPAAFSAEKNSEICFVCEFFPVTNGIHTENIIVASDTCDIQVLTLTGESIAYEPNMIFIQDSKRLLNFPEEKNSENNYILEFGRLMPFTTSVKGIKVINSCSISFKYAWVSIKDCCPEETDILSSESSKIYWSVKSNKGELKKKVNDFSFETRLDDCPFGRFRHIFGLILEGVPITSIKKDEVIKMKTTLGSPTSQQGGFINLLVEKVEICVECVPLNLKIHPPLILQTSSMKCDQLFVSEVSISNQNDIPVYYSWKNAKSNKFGVMDGGCRFKLQGQAF